MTTPITHLVLDMDGVLWRGDTPMPGLAGFFATLRRLGIGFVLATNNASKTAAMYTGKLARFGVDVPPEQILTSAETTAAYLSHEYARGAAAYLVGAQGLHDAMTAQGFRIVSPAEVRAGATADVVVVGFTPHACYDDFAMGALLVRNGVRFIGTNPDPTFPSELGPLPGAGALQAIIERATGIEPLIIGKPRPIVFNEAVRLLGSDAAHTAMVGDRLSTDITGAKAAGLQAILVLSGISTREEAAAAEIKPDYIFDDITALARFLEERAFAD